MTSRRADRIGGPYALHQAPIGPPGRYRLTTELDDCCVPEQDKADALNHLTTDH